MVPTKPTADLSERDNKETLFVKEEEVTNDAEVFGEVEADVEGSQKEPLSSVSLLVFKVLRAPATTVCPHARGFGVLVCWSVVSRGQLAPIVHHPPHLNYHHYLHQAPTPNYRYSPPPSIPNLSPGYLAPTTATTHPPRNPAAFG